MPNWGFLLIALFLIVIALWFIRKNYKHFYKGYKIDLSDKKFILNGLWVLLKTCISLFVLIIIHNLYHKGDYILMIIISVVFISISILQSEYARVGFHSRFKFIFNYIGRTFLERRKQVQSIFRGLENDDFDRYLIVVKVILLIILFFIFLSQIGYFVLTNLFYVLVISSFILLAFVLNNLIYFGFTSLIVLQYYHALITFDNINLYVLIIAFLIIFLGMQFDDIFNQRICVIRGNYYIKNINFDTKFNLVYRTNKLLIYQHLVNRMYYIHYRSVGYVLAFESYYDAKLYKSIQRKMINSGKAFLIKNKGNLKEYL